MNNKKKMRFTESELAIIKGVFADRDDLLMVLRKVFLLAELSKDEVTLIKSAFNTEVIKAVRKSFLPEIELDAPINQVIDLWMTVDVKDKSIDDVVVTLKSREALIELLNTGVKRLSDPEMKVENVMDFKLGETKIQIAKDLIKLIARNTLVSHTEAQLLQLEILAGQKEETVEQTVERLQKDSSK